MAKRRQCRFQWDQPFASASVGAAGSQSDLDIVLTDAACNNPNVNSADLNVGRDPVEVFGVINNGHTAAVGLQILRRSGPNPGLMKTVLFGSSSLTINELGTQYPDHHPAHHHRAEVMSPALTLGRYRRGGTRTSPSLGRVRNFVRKTQKKSIRGVLQIRSAAGTGTGSIETRRIKIRLKRQGLAS